MDVNRNKTYKIHFSIEMEAKSKKLLAQERFIDSLNLVFQGNTLFFLIPFIVIQLKEDELGYNDPNFLSYLTEIIKLFN